LKKLIDSDISKVFNKKFNVEKTFKLILNSQQGIGLEDTLTTNGTDGHKALIAKSCDISQAITMKLSIDGQI